MTKQQALAEFKEYYLPSIREMEKEYGNGVDDVMRREEWNNYTDSLCSDRRITEYKYNNWSNPF